MSKIIGTISLNINTDDFNYGAILHSWAFQKYLINYLNLECEIIDYTTPKLENYNRKYPLLNYLKQKRLKTFFRTLLRFNKYLNRYKKFEKFKKENMIISNKKYNQEKLNNSNLKYDTLICESDVIWSPGFMGGKFDKTFFLALDSMKEKKKIAYSPSMGDCDIKGQGDDLKKFLKEIDFISCRETYEKTFLSKYTSKDISHVLDPVFLLQDNDYDEIIGDRIIDDKYILLYLPVNDNQKLRESALIYANENSLKIVEISTKLERHHHQIDLLDAGVEEFLSAIKNAEIIFTNSFHAICFSLIFNKEFYAFSRKYNGKIKDICSLFDLNDRFLADDKFELKKNIDYNITNEKILNLRFKSQQWLKDSLDGD